MAEQDDYIKTALRLPRMLHHDVQNAAESAGRSMNAEIIERLEYSMPREQYEDIRQKLEEYQANMDAMKAASSELRELYEKQDASARRMEAIDDEKSRMTYKMLKMVADALSKPDRTPEDERNLLAELIKTMTILATVKKYTDD
jgi:predicted nuclease with TOPRIM domain